MDGVTVRIARLADHLKGFYDKATTTIWLDNRLSPAAHRCTLEHEHIHYERGDTDPEDPWWRSKQERLVHREAARRLIPFDALLDAWRFSDDIAHLCDALFVDKVTLMARLDSLSDEECGELQQAAAHRRDCC